MKVQSVSSTEKSSKKNRNKLQGAKSNIQGSQATGRRLIDDSFQDSEDSQDSVRQEVLRYEKMHYNRQRPQQLALNDDWINFNKYLNNSRGLDRTHIANSLSGMDISADDLVDTPPPFQSNHRLGGRGARAGGQVQQQGSNNNPGDLSESIEAEPVSYQSMHQTNHFLQVPR